MERLRLTSAHLTNCMTVECGETRRSTWVGTLDDMIPFITEVKAKTNASPPYSTATFSARFALHFWTKELGHSPVMLDKVFKSLKAFQVATSGQYCTVHKGPQGTEPQVVAHLFRVYKYGFLLVRMPLKFFLAADCRFTIFSKIFI